MKLFDDLHAFLWNDPATNNANTYLIDGPKRILIDPGHAHLFGAVRARLEALTLSPSDLDLVIVTHAHPDHMEALQFFSGTPTLTAFPKQELESMRADPARYSGLFGPAPFEPEILLQGGRLQVGDRVFEIYPTPGHSPGSICIYWPDKRALFSGDVVFRQGVGRTDLPGGSSEELRESILQLKRLEVEYLLPGHGDIVQGGEAVRRNFEEIESYWFALL